MLLDSTVAIGGERRNLSARQLLTEVSTAWLDEEIGLSAVSVMELAHGIARADSAARRSKRLRFLQELLTVMPVYPLDTQIAFQAGQVDGTLQSRGITVAAPDLMIGITALVLGYRVATRNERHFRRIPGLEVLVL